VEVSLKAHAIKIRAIAESSAVRGQRRQTGRGRRCEPILNIKQAKSSAIEMSIGDVLNLIT
jgi:hypothetical protein